MGGGFPQLCGDQPHTAFPLGQTESALHFHTVAFITVILRLVSGFALPGPSQRRAGEPDAMLLAKAEVFPVPVYLQDAAGIMPLPIAEPFCHLLQFSSLIVGVKGADLQPRPPIHNADIQFCAELHRFSGFSTHNGTHKWLTYADNPVRYTVRAVVIHVLLLPVDGSDGIQTFRLPRIQHFPEGQLAVDGVKVSPEVS